MVSFEGIPCEIRMFRGFENTNTNTNTYALTLILRNVCGNGYTSWSFTFKIHDLDFSHPVGRQIGAKYAVPVLEYTNMEL